MPRYHFTSNGHKIEIKVADDGLEILHDGKEVTDINNPSYLNQGGFRVVEDDDEWKVESKSFFSQTFIHTIRRNGEIVLEVEVPHCCLLSSSSLRLISLRHSPAQHHSPPPPQQPRTRRATETVRPSQQPHEQKPWVAATARVNKRLDYVVDDKANDHTDSHNRIDPPANPISPAASDDSQPSNSKHNNWQEDQDAEDNAQPSYRRLRHVLEQFRQLLACPLLEIVTALRTRHAGAD